MFFISTALATPGPRPAVENIFELARSSDLATNEQAQRSINNFIDFTTITLNVLGKHVASVPKKDLVWVTNTLQEIIGLTVYPKAAEFLKDVTIKFGEEKIIANQATVYSTIKKKADTTEVNFTLKKIKDEWKVIDITLDDESWVLNIKTQVNDIIKKEKWDGVKKRLNNKLSKLKLENK